MKNFKKYLKKYLLLSLLFLIFGCETSKPLDDEHLIIGTFNMEWLGDGIDDNKPRSEADMQQIADIISSSGMEVIAVQEVENDVALARVVAKLENFKFKISKNRGKQKNAVIYKDYITIKEIGDYEPLSLNNEARSGYVLNVSKNDYHLLVMSIHLKSTSRFDSTDELRLRSRLMRSEQAQIISNWADSLILKEGVKELVVLGDFNDYPNRQHNQTLQAIVENPNLHFLSEEYRSCKEPLWHGIDHIVGSSYTQQRYVPNSFFIYDFNSMLTASEAEKISDHCPISIQLKIK